MKYKTVLPKWLEAKEERICVICRGQYEIRRTSKGTVCFWCRQRANKDRKPSLKAQFRNYKNGAYHRELEFKLTITQFRGLKNRPCSYCGYLAEPDRMGIDRVDNSVGYIKGNVTPCCTTCNQMKRALSVEEFIQHCSNIARRFSQLST